jgi:hypothetical protein
MIGRPPAALRRAAYAGLRRAFLIDSDFHEIPLFWPFGSDDFHGGDTRVLHAARLGAVKSSGTFCASAIGTKRHWYRSLKSSSFKTPCHLAWRLLFSEFGHIFSYASVYRAAPPVPTMKERSPLSTALPSASCGLNSSY